MDIGSPIPTGLQGWAQPSGVTQPGHRVANRAGGLVCLPFLRPRGSPRCLLSVADGFLQGRHSDPELPTSSVITLLCPRSGQAHPVKGSSLFLQGLGTSAAPAPSCPVLGTTPLAPALALASAVPLNPSLPSCTWRELPEAPAWHNLPPVCRKEVSHWLPGLGFPTWGVFTSSQQPRPP